MRSWQKWTSTCSKIIRCPAIVLTFVVSIVPVGCLTIASTWHTIGRYIRDIDNLSSLSNGFIWSLPSDTPDINFYSVPINRCFTSFRTERSPDTGGIALSFNVFDKVIDIATIAFAATIVFIRSDMNSGHAMQRSIWSIEEFVIDGFDKFKSFFIFSIQVQHSYALNIVLACIIAQTTLIHEVWADFDKGQGVTWCVNFWHQIDMQGLGKFNQILHFFLGIMLI